MTEIDSTVDLRDATWLLKEKYAGVPSPAYEADLERLRDGEPLAYVIGWVDFLGSRLDLYARPLIPRPETEFWTTHAIAAIKNRLTPQAAPRILDLCAGSGCIGIALLKHLPHARVDFVEKNGDLLSEIEKNIRGNDIDTARARVTGGDLFENARGPYDVIVANPPYIDLNKGDVTLSVIEYEPHEALFAPKRGLGVIEKIFSDAKKVLAPNGVLFVEFGAGQEKDVALLATTHGFSVSIHPDQSGRPRWCQAE